MNRRRARAVLVMALGLLPATAKAEAAPPPGFRELELALIIARAGFDCPAVDSIEVTTNPQPGWEILRPEVAVCKNGKRFMVVTSGRRNTRPVVRPLSEPGRE
jgi:hypothetical protein